MSPQRRSERLLRAPDVSTGLDFGSVSLLQFAYRGEAQQYC